MNLEDIAKEFLLANWREATALELCHESIDETITNSCPQSQLVHFYQASYPLYDNT